jgi:hypothetical protein
MFDFDCENIDKQDEEQNQTLMQLINPRKKYFLKINLTEVFTLVSMANLDIAAIIKRQIPISATFLATGRRTSFTNL